MEIPGASRSEGIPMMKVGYHIEDRDKEKPQLIAYLGKGKPDKTGSHIYHDDTSGTYHECYHTLMGRVIESSVREIEFTKGKKKIKVHMLECIFEYDGSPVRVSFGRITGPFARNFLGRCIRKECSLSSYMKISPYKSTIIDEKTKEAIELRGISVRQGPDMEIIPSMKREDIEEYGIPASDQLPDGTFDHTNATRYMYKAFLEKLKKAVATLGVEEKSYEEEDFAAPPEDLMAPESDEPTKGDLGGKLYKDTEKGFDDDGNFDGDDDLPF